jgi:hypothetical protein
MRHFLDESRSQPKIAQPFGEADLGRIAASLVTYNAFALRVPRSLRFTQARLPNMRKNLSRCV